MTSEELLALADKIIANNVAGTGAKELQNEVDKHIAEMYHRFILKSINLLSVSLATIGEDSYSTEQVVVVLEFSYDRPKDGRMIWPKIAVSGTTVLEAVIRAEKIIDDIRSR